MARIESPILMLDLCEWEVENKLFVKYGKNGSLCILFGVFLEGNGWGQWLECTHGESESILGYRS